MRRIAVVTVGRSDYGLYRPILRRIAADPGLELRLVVSGAHLAEGHGDTRREIEFAAAAEVDLRQSGDTPGAVGAAAGRGVTGFAEAFARLRPDLLLLLGDRFEMHAAAVAALPFNLPVAHIHGGELTAGAMDDALRHSLTKLSHLHFVSTVDHGRRVVRMGEEPWRVVCSGAPGLDRLDDFAPEASDELPPRFLLATFHPVTLEPGRTARQVDELLAALDAVALPVVFTYPNADPGRATIVERIEAFARDREQVRVVPHAGERRYLTLLARAAAMVGNSSSGLLEAPSFRLPVVNVGRRQEGRTRARNVIDCPPERAAIVAALRRALEPGFRESLAGLVNPYRAGGAASEIIVDRLATVELDERLVVKRFFEEEPVPC